MSEELAEAIRKRFMPLCVCDECGNVREGNLIKEIIDFVRGGAQ